MARRRRYEMRPLFRVPVVFRKESPHGDAAVVVGEQAIRNTHEDVPTQKVHTAVAGQDLLLRRRVVRKPPHEGVQRLARERPRREKDSFVFLDRDAQLLADLHDLRGLGDGHVREQKDRNQEEPENGNRESGIDRPEPSRRHRHLCETQEAHVCRFPTAGSRFPARRPGGNSSGKFTWRSKARAAAKRVSSPNRRAMIWMPSGRFPRDRPEGTEIAGSPARDAGTVKTSDRYIVSGSSTFSPSRKAGAGIVGHTITSTASKARSKSSSRSCLARMARP